MKIIKINSFAGCLLAIAALACTREAPEANPSLGQIKEITITASYDDPETRTERAADGAVLWSPGDEISLFYGSGTNGGSRFVGQNTEPSKVVNFTGNIGVITGGNDVAIEDTYFWAVYPYNPTASCNGSSITTTLPSLQAAKADTFADDLFPSVGRSQGLVMGFYNICGGLKFTISEEGIKSVTLRGHNNEILSGTITVGFDDGGQPIVQNITDGSETIVVSALEGETLEVGKAYYIVFVPTVFENGFTLTFDKGYASAVYDRTKKTTIRRSAFGGLTTPDKDLEWTLRYVPIPDANFKAYMIQNYDTNGNGELDFDEAGAVTSIEVSTDNIESVAGIEYCTNLEILKCGGSSVMVVDGESVSTGLLTKLDVSHNTALTVLYCRHNRIESLDVNNNPLIQTLDCGENLLSSLDISLNPCLEYLYCFKNSISSLDVSQNTKLYFFNCHDNQLSNLDVSYNSKLAVLACSNNQLSYVDLTNNKVLQWLECDAASLTSLDVSENKYLQILSCQDNNLTTLDISANNVLETLSCGSNNLSSLDISANRALQTLRCGANNLTSIDISGNYALQYLSCENNQLTTLDVTGNPKLLYLNCLENPYLEKLWLKSGQSINQLEYNPQVTTLYYKGETGLSDTPTIIATAEEFQAFMANPTYDVILGADIDLSGSSIASVESYRGIVNGDGHSIKGLVASVPLFKTLEGAVKNLIIDSSCSFEPGVSLFGIVAGDNKGVISNVTNYANVTYTVSIVPDPVLIAAIAGKSSGVIDNCINEGTIVLNSSGSVTGLGVAGIVAYQSWNIKNCTNRGVVSFSAPNISGKATVVDAENALPSVGGVCAIGAHGFSMTYCHNYGRVSYNLYSAETDLNANRNRNQIGGVVASPCGDVINCNNYGEVNVSIKHSTPGTSLPYEFIACVGGIGGGDYLFTSTSGTISNTSYYNCINEGSIIVDSDASRSNTAVGGIVGWPGQEKSTSTVASACVNRGTIIGRGVMKCRLGGIEGGTGNMMNCVNEGKITLESGNTGSALGSLCGFHSQRHYIEGCTAGGEVICEVPGVTGGVGGLIGNMGNVANETASGCVVNCKITVASYNTQRVGFVVGFYNGSSAKVTLGTESSPIQVSGSINGTPASDSNIYGTANDLNHTIYYVIN